MLLLPALIPMLVTTVAALAAVVRAIRIDPVIMLRALKRTTVSR
jgi:hypothetical protein